MIIENIRIKNFKAFKNQSIKLNKNTLFIGNNDSGKTTILQALDVFFNVDDIDTKFIRDINKRVEISILVNRDNKYYHIKKVYSKGDGILERVYGNQSVIKGLSYIYVPLNDIDVNSLISKLVIHSATSLIDVDDKMRSAIDKSINDISSNIGNYIQGRKNFDIKRAFTSQYYINSKKADGRKIIHKLLTKGKYNNLIIGLDQIENILYKNIEKSLMSTIDDVFHQVLVTTHSKRIVKASKVYNINPLYKGSVEKVASFYSEFDENKKNIYVIVEGKYDLPWIKKCINILNLKDNYIVVPGGGCGNLKLLNKVLSRNGHKCKIILDGDTKSKGRSLKRDCIELYTPLDDLNRIFGLSLSYVPLNKREFFRVCLNSFEDFKHRNDDSIKAILANNAHSFLKEDNPLIEEVKNLLK